MLSKCSTSILFISFWCSSLLLLVWTVPPSCQAWVIVSSSRSRSIRPTLPRSLPCRSSSTCLASSTTANTGSGSITTPADDDSDDDDVEYEYVEYDTLSDRDFVGSEWLVGTNWDSNLDKIDETWVRLAVDEKTGTNIAIWGDGRQGKWNLDVASQFFSVSKESKLGISKEIWAGVVEDFYFLQGTVRGWTFWQAASVLAQWQAKRLGIDPQEAGTPPWFLNADDSDDESSSS